MPSTRRRIWFVLERTTTRALPLLNRAVDLTPTAQACCGVCRTCATTNIVGVALAAVAGVGVALKRVVARSSASSASI
jgi:branched-subunit amino acid ABC-type transport system permease component